MKELGIGFVRFTLEESHIENQPLLNDGIGLVQSKHVRLLEPKRIVDDLIFDGLFFGVGGFSASPTLKVRDLTRNLAAGDHNREIGSIGGGQPLNSEESEPDEEEVDEG